MADMLKSLQSPTPRFLLVVGALPIALIAAFIAMQALNLSLRTLGLSLLTYWALGLWFVLSASARRDAQPHIGKLFVLGFWLTLTLFMVTVALAFVLPPLVFLGV